jgi:hypothetical protein
LKPAEFYDLTPIEFRDYCDGVAKRERRELEQKAWFAATLINHSGNVRKAVHPYELLGWGRSLESFHSADEAREFMRRGKG